MKNIKMIVTDLDGTLLRTDKTVSDFTRAVFSKCREAGIKTVYATGRGASAERLVPSELFDGRIMMNGALGIVDNRVVYRRTIPYLTAQPLLLACHRHGLKVVSESGGMHYTNFVVPKEWQSIITNYEIVDFSLHCEDAEKLYAQVNNSEDAAFIQKNLPKDLYMVLSGDGLAMVMHKEATKSKAVAELQRIWGIKQEEICAFGDEMNDFDMLSYAGKGVAVENALDKIKAVADFICLSNNEDGVAKWLIDSVL